MASIHKRTIRWTTKDGEQRTGERYQARYVGEDGKEHAKLFAKKKDAQTWLDQQTASLVRGDWADPKAGRETLRAYATRWEKIQVGSEATKRLTDNALRVHILPKLGDMKLSSIRRSDVQAFIKHLETKEIRPATDTEPARLLSPGSIRNIYERLASVLDAAVEDRAIGVTPCKRITLPKDHDDEVVIPTLEDIEKVRNALDDRWKVIPLFLCGTGVRIGEGLGLDPADIDFLKRPSKVRVRRQLLQSNELGPLKTRRSRRDVPIGTVTLEELAAHLNSYPAPEGGGLFADELGERLTYRRWKRLLQEATAAAGVELTSHSFRHFAASALISAGASVKQVQEFLGHSSPVITLRTYAHLWPGDEDRTRNALDAALSPLSNRADSRRTGAASKVSLRRSET